MYLNIHIHAYLGLCSSTARPEKHQPQRSFGYFQCRLFWLGVSNRFRVYRVALVEKPTEVAVVFGAVVYPNYIEYQGSLKWFGSWKMCFFSNIFSTYVSFFTWSILCTSGSTERVPLPFLYRNIDDIGCGHQLETERERKIKIKCTWRFRQFSLHSTMIPILVSLVQHLFNMIMSKTTDLSDSCEIWCSSSGGTRFLKT